jgi:hypothetical protein
MSTRNVAVLLPLLLTACGGGGGGGAVQPTPTPTPTPSVTGSVFAPTSGPGDTQLYFPLGAGDQWFYNATTNDPTASAPTGFSVVSVNGSHTVKNVSATVVTTASPIGASAGTIDNYYYASPGGITYLGNNDATDAITPLIIPYPQLLFPVNTGQVASIAGMNLSLGDDTQGNPITGSLNYTIANADFESVTVPAGIFPKALKQVTSTSVSGTDSLTHQTVTVTGTDTLWLVPGVGIVKEVTVIDSSPSVTTENDLRGYLVNGTGHGLGVPVTIASGTAISSIPGNFSSAPAIATDGTNFLVAVPQVAGAGVAQTLTWVGYVVEPGGTVLRSFNLTAAFPAPMGGSTQMAALGYDGTNYLFVYASPNVAPSLVAESVSPTGTVLAGPTTIVGAAGSSPALAFNGTNYLLVFVGSNAVTQTDQVFAQALSPSSAQAIGSGPVPLVANTGATGQYQSEIAVASNGANFLAVWDGCSGGGACGIYASRLDSTGTVLDSTAIAIVNPPGTSTGASADAPAVAFDGQNYLVAYVDYRPQGGSGNSNISAARISPAGTLLDGIAATAGIAITTTPGSNSSPLSVASMGGESWVTWSSGSVSAETQVGGALVSTAGQVAHPLPAGTPLFAPPITGGQVLTVTAGRAGAGLLAWLALPFAAPTATPASSFGTMAMYP